MGSLTLALLLLSGGTETDTPPVPMGPAATQGAAPSTRVKNRRLERNQTVAKAMYEAGLDDATVTSLHGALSVADFNFRKARAGDQLRFVFRNGELDLLEYRRNLQTEWQVRREANRYVARKRELERELRVAVVELKVESSVWDATMAAGERPDVAVALSDVFAWDLDFYRDVQRGDRMRAVIEKVLHKGKVIAYGNVLAAEYIGSSVGTKKTYRYRLPDGSETYFAEDGTSARKTFLKSPLKFSQVTSRFGGRFHPVLNAFGKHNGVDFHAGVGTPVWAVADGTVTRAGWEDGGGNVVCLKHSMGFETCYMHLSKLEVRPGQRVAQKAVIAESGNTGRLTTGPHLHFGMKRGGSWVNPLNQNFPRAEPLPRSLLADFRQKTAEVAARLAARSLAAL